MSCNLSRPLAGLFIFSSLGACAAQEDPQEASTEQAIASIMGGVEAAIDAPWRLEPDPSSARLFPVIPIVVSIHDASLQSDPGTAVDLGQLCEISVREEPQPNGPTRFMTRPPEEIERSNKWPYSSDVASGYSFCRRWIGESCAAELDVGSSAEWHGTLLYEPAAQTPGADVHLTVMARVARRGFACGPAIPIVEHAPFDRFGSTGTSYVITNRLTVHLGDAPLPRFDESWVYGDLHYHSQGTDNEGESAYAYRPTLQAMRAMGLDFLFATDHASDSGQTTDIDAIYVDNIDLPYVPEAVEDLLEDLVANLAVGFETSTNAARDMNPQRFAAMRSLLNDPGGANAGVMELFGRRKPSRIFLGGEVDVIPEMSAAERTSGMIGYGNGAGYLWRAACDAVPGALETMAEWTTASICDSPYDLAEAASEGGRYLVKDIQGLGDQYFARQHMLHLPVDGTRADAFVSSQTTLYGGARRRLKDVLRDDYEAGHKGYAFLAHPALAASGSGVGRLGPDIVPYSNVQLRTAFESPSILGLQVWNEDPRLRTGDTGWGFPLQREDQPPFSLRWEWGRWLGKAPARPYREIHDGAVGWDRMLQWGIRPSQTAGLPWLAPGQPRRVFMAGGSDAHGDLNYRREGSVTGVSVVVDTAIGKPRNLVQAGAERPERVRDGSGQDFGAVGQVQVTSALAAGTFSVTDGPALRIAIDRNANGAIDSADVPMGGLTQVPAEGSYVPLIVEWKSTAEFGGVSGIDLYVGVANDAYDTSLVYAPEHHGVLAASALSGRTSHPYLDASGAAHAELWDGYMLDPTGRLHVTVGAAEAAAGRRVVYLRANDYVVGTRRIHEEEPVCTPNAYCNKPGFSELCDDECTTPPPPAYHFDHPARPDRFYVRAFARTTPKGGALCNEVNPPPMGPAGTAQRSGQCIERMAFTNPIWVSNHVAPPPPPPPAPAPSPIRAGGACDGSVPCVCGAYCSPSARVCTAKALAGAPCDAPDACVDTAYCADRRCAARPTAGQSCSASVPCAAGLVCARGACITSPLPAPAACTPPPGGR